MPTVPRAPLMARSFDYAEAQRLRDQGHKVLWIAMHLGVSVWSVYRATDGGRRIAYDQRRWQERA